MTVEKIFLLPTSKSKQHRPLRKWCGSASCDASRGGQRPAAAVAVAEEEEDWPRREEDAEADAVALDALADADAAAEAAAAESPLAEHPSSSLASPFFIRSCRTGGSNPSCVHLFAP